MRRLIAAGAAVLMAAVGAMILVGYLRSADQRANARALAGVRTESVLVATGVIAKQTPADKLASLVTVKELPRVAVVNGAVAKIGDLAGEVATVDIQPGEQLLKSRFADPNALPASGDVPVPNGTEQVSVLLEAQRVVGGLITPGSHVGVYTPTQRVADNVLVTRVQDYLDASSGSAKPTASAGQAGTSTAAPDAKMMITLAVAPQQAQAFVAGAENSQIWLSLNKSDAH